MVINILKTLEYSDFCQIIGNLKPCDLWIRYWVTLHDLLRKFRDPWDDSWGTSFWKFCDPVLCDLAKL